MTTIFIINSPLEQFEIVNLISITAPIIAPFILSLTNLGLYAILTCIIIIGLHIIGNNNYRLVPSKWSVIIETIYASIYSIVASQIGTNYTKYIPFIYALFCTILVANLNGNIPYAYTITSSIVTAIGLSIIVFIAVTVLAGSIHGIHAFSYFVPQGTPLPLIPILTLIEGVSYAAWAVSLGVRLFSNIVSGHTIIVILSTLLFQIFSSGILIAIVTLIPYTIFIGLIGLEIAVSLIQSYVFVVLTSSYLKDAHLLH